MVSTNRPRSVFDSRNWTSSSSAVIRRTPARSPASRPNLGSRRLSRGPSSCLTRPLDQLADASESGSQLVPLQQESLACLAEVAVLSAQPVNPTAELTNLLGHRGETALELVDGFDPFLPAVEELPTFLDPTGEGDLAGVLRGHTALFTPPLPPPLRPHGEHHTEGSPD